MKPYYHDEHAGITIYHGDCREVLPTLTEKVDAVVTDPPYGIGWSRATWNDDPAAYPELMGWLVGESNRIVPDGFVFVFQGMPNVGHFHEWFPDGWRLFAACKNFAQIRPTGVWHSWDPVVFWRNGPNTAPNTATVNRDYHVGNVAGVLGDHNGHPSPRPIDTVRHIVAIASPNGGTVLDPFMGSGTTLRAAKDLGRRAIGIEIEERYAEIAARRLEQEVLPLRYEEQRTGIQSEILAGMACSESPSEGSKMRDLFGGLPSTRPTKEVR
jgi:site-specific DNA-methyltransferase (adenine-specific)